MPYKCKKQKSKSKKTKYRVTNWPKYNKALRQRGDITFWFSEDAIAQWTPTKDEYQGMGCPRTYSDLAIETALMIRQVFSLTLRATQGFMESLVKLMGLELSIPDYSCLSRRSDGLKLQKLLENIEPGSHVIIDSSGLKVYGKDEWHQEKHKVKANRTWRKLHLAIDEKHNIIATELTTNKVGDVSAVPDLLNQIEHVFDTFIADGAYDGKPTYDAIEEKQPGAKVIIPPPKNGVVHEDGPSQRNEHIETINEKGRAAWQDITNYGRRSLVELAMLRYKTLIGNKLKARELPRQIAEAQASVRAINKMTQLGMPVSVKVA